MDSEVVARLRALNRTFYEKLAAPFAQTRSHPQPGFFLLLDHLPVPCLRLLDVGCGEGRFGRFLQEHSAVEEYVGVDLSPQLLARAREAVDGTFLVRDLSRPRSLEHVGDFPAVACLAVLQHIPGRENRLGLLQEIVSHLSPEGRLFISTWQFLDSERQRRKIAPWGAVELSPDQVEDNDYLLTWRRDGFGLRYVCYIDSTEMRALAQEAGLNVVEQFRSDGREGNLNLYTILEKV